MAADFGGQAPPGQVGFGGVGGRGAKGFGIGDPETPYKASQDTSAGVSSPRLWRACPPLEGTPALQSGEDAFGEGAAADVVGIASGGALEGALDGGGGEAEFGAGGGEFDVVEGEEGVVEGKGVPSAAVGAVRLEDANAGGEATLGVLEAANREVSPEGDAAPAAAVEA